jgi:lipoprotein-anchoring transpeptidase ErfK/SrfK
LHQGTINLATYNSIITAHRYHQVPPQNTPLGGRIGIHGLGRADAKIHKTMNWTHGCIALTNGQIDHLSQWVDTGTRVKIK